jgi:iron complex outermembrane receptor protein
MRFHTVRRGLMGLALAFGMAGAPHTAAATTTAFDAPNTISGQVTSTHGEAVAQATVRVVELMRSTMTDPDGRFRLAMIASGRYTISVTAIGYAPRVRKVIVGDTVITVNVTLTPAAVELPDIQVSASAEATSALNSPQPVAQVSGAQLREEAATTLGDAVEGTAGVRNNSSGPRDRRA